MNEDSAHPSAMQMDENKTCTPLIIILKCLFCYALLPVAIYKLLQICEHENSPFESKSLLHIMVVEHGLF